MMMKTLCGDVVAFDGDPMEDITAMTRCCFVMKGGEVYKA